MVDEHSETEHSAHEPKVYRVGKHHGKATLCARCDEVWPCPTARREHLIDPTARPIACSCGRAKYAGSPTFVRERHSIHASTEVCAAFGCEPGWPDRDCPIHGWSK